MNYTKQKKLDESVDILISDKQNPEKTYSISEKEYLEGKEIFKRYQKEGLNVDQISVYANEIGPIKMEERLETWGIINEQPTRLRYIDIQTIPYLCK